MASSTRIPQAEITGIKGALMKRMATKMMGQVPTPLGVYWHNPKVLKASFAIGNKVQKWDTCDENLKSFAHMAVASLVGCTWCLDFNYFQAHNENLDLEKAREVPRWRESDVFTPLERNVMAYAEAMSQTPPTVTDELAAQLLEQLGAAADAEDVVHETWLRWADVDRAEVRDPRAYLVRIVTRQALNRLRTLSRRREEYVGEWLPEPLLTSPDVAEDVEFAESVSIAMLTVLETLAPTERAVFVLREVFDVPYADIAAAVDKTPAAVRQIAHRARGHVLARRPRIQVDLAEHQKVVDRLLPALRTGDLQVLLDVLAPDVVLVADS